MCPRDGGAIDDDAIVILQSVLHAATDDVVRTVDVGIEKHSAKNDCYHEANETSDIFDKRVFLKKSWFH